MTDMSVGRGPETPGETSRLHAEIATRLRSVCADMPAERFDQLVREIARVKVKYDAESHGR